MLHSCRIFRSIGIQYRLFQWVLRHETRKTRPTIYPKSAIRTQFGQARKTYLSPMVVFFLGGAENLASEDGILKTYDKANHGSQTVSSRAYAGARCAFSQPEKNFSLTRKIIFPSWGFSCFQLPKPLQEGDAISKKIVTMFDDWTARRPCGEVIPTKSVEPT